MAEQKTKPTAISVKDFLDKKATGQVREDCNTLIKLMKKATGSNPKMWGPSIVGFGSYHYKYESGHEGDSCLTGFSPRTGNISLYVMLSAAENTDLLNKLGKHKVGKGCLYVKKLGDVDIKILETLIKRGVDSIRKKYPAK